MESLLQRSEAIKAEAKRLGFTDCGIAKASELTEEKPRFLNWLEQGYHADMAYMARNIEKRLDPTNLVEGAKSVIVLLQNYFPEKYQFQSKYKIAKYAYGKDYHSVLKNKLFQLFQFINNEIAPCKGRCFTDSAPVLERAWAVKAGLGWVGKNSNVLTRNHGSFFFIGEIILDLELCYDKPTLHNYCGSCTLCIDHCPTKAIIAPGIVDANKCISYLTIENKKEIPDHFRGKRENWIFGCDICQDICPWNKKTRPTNEVDYIPHPDLLQMTDENWESLTESQFNQLFKESPVSRAGFSGIQRNINS